jgi:hypothetical protein
MGCGLMGRKADRSRQGHYVMWCLGILGGRSLYRSFPIDDGVTAAGSMGLVDPIGGCWLQCSGLFGDFRFFLLLFFFCFGFGLEMGFVRCNEGSCH